jgi:hypothetical protein
VLVGIVHSRGLLSKRWFDGLELREVKTKTLELDSVASTTLIIPVRDLVAVVYQKDLEMYR